MLYNYIFENGHCVIDIDGEKWLLDTGSPATFCFDGSKSKITIDGINYQLTHNPGFNVDNVMRVVGIELKGMIGFDLLSQTSFALYKNNTMEFKVDEKALEKLSSINSIPLSINKNVILGEATIEDKKVRVLYDTGAHISYLKPGILNRSVINNVTDYDYSGNVIKSDVVMTITRIGAATLKLSFAVPIDNTSYPVYVMRQVKCDAIIGLYDHEFENSIFYNYYAIDYKNKILYFN